MKMDEYAKHEDIETALHVWFKEVRSKDAPISGSLMLERRNELSKQMSIASSANPRWLERFKKRNGTVLKMFEKIVLPTMTENLFQFTLPSILEEHKAKYVFNANANGEKNNKIDIEQFDTKKVNAKKNIRLFSKNSLISILKFIKFLRCFCLIYFY
ncbi:hypothetical protein TNCV_4318841 [Trichonephila clavipes]|nr:hypothetical protein TNCV_4318841 [Trichonephila clavipes]